MKCIKLAIIKLSGLFGVKTEVDFKYSTTDAILAGYIYITICCIGIAAIGAIIGSIIGKL